jgi:TonB family protein
VTAVAVAHTYHPIPHVEGSAALHPVPQGKRVDDSSALLKRSAVASIGLHLLVIIVAVAIQYWPSSAVIGTPQDQILDVTIIPLSAFDTILPKGSPVEDVPLSKPPSADTIPEPPAPKQPKPVEQKKIVAAKSLASLKSEHVDSKSTDKSERGAKPDISGGQNQIGVANGEAVTLEQARISYQDMIATKLARAKRYPERALKRRMTGEGTIRIEISADGTLSGFQIIQSTDAPILDEELRAMVERASPFPAFPADLRKGSLALVVPVAFRLEG